MKQIKAVIKPERLSEVREALKSAKCYHGIMISDIVGQGTQMGVTQAWRGEKYQLDLIPKVMIDLVVLDTEVATVKKIILENARTGEIGDGKIFIYNVEEVIRIRTGEEGEGAV
jgi:nitrogen regulatory protein PII